jgi:hypothetical protein
MSKILAHESISVKANYPLVSVMVWIKNFGNWLKNLFVNE